MRRSIVGEPDRVRRRWWSNRGIWNIFSIAVLMVRLPWVSSHRRYDANLVLRVV
jgi:hypothetical protein